MKKSVYVKIYVFVFVFSIAFYFYYTHNVQDSYANKDGKETIIFRLAEAQTESYPSAYASSVFAKLVEERSNGRIKIKVYTAGALGKEEQVIEQVQFGGIDFARVNLASLAKYSSKINVLMLPYLIKNDLHMQVILTGDYGNKIQEELAKEKISCLAWLNGGQRGFYSTKKYVKSIEDLTNLKINAIQPKMMLEFYSKQGIHIVSNKQIDLYGLLQSGAIDGVEGSLISYYVSRHYEVAPYFTNSEHVVIPEVLIVSRSILLSLSKDDQLMIEQAAREAAIIQKRVWSEMERDILVDLANKQVKTNNVFDKKIFIVALQPLYQAFDLSMIKKITDY